MTSRGWHLTVLGLAWIGILLVDARPAAAAVVAWSPGSVYQRSYVQLLGWPSLCAHEEFTVPYFAGPFATIVVDSGGTSVMCNPECLGSGTAASRYFVRFSAQGAIHRSNLDTHASRGQGPGVCYPASIATSQTMGYMFTLDGPTEVTLRLEAVRSGGPNTGLGHGGVYAEVRAGVSNLFPAFSFPQFGGSYNGILQQTETLPAGTYEFGSGHQESSSVWSGTELTDSHFGGCVVSLTIGPPVAVVPGASASGPARIALDSNPARVSAGLRIQASLPRAGDSEIALFDLGGRRVGTIHQGHLEEGPASFEWRPPNPLVGVYFLRLSGPGFSAVSRVALIP